MNTRAHLLMSLVIGLVLSVASSAHAVVGVGLDGHGMLLLSPDQVAQCDSGDGKYQRTYPNGKKMVIGTCKGGLYTGTWKAFHPSGEKMWVVEFEGGRPKGTFESWYPNGAAHVKASYTNGAFDGTFKSFHSNGKVEATGAYREGKRAGCWETYYPSGEHASKGAYNAGKEVGSWLKWDAQQNKSRDKFGGETAQGACLLML